MQTLTHDARLSSVQPARARRRTAGARVGLWAVFLVALTLLAAGIGLALPRLSKEGMVTGTWLGLGLVVVGLLVAVIWILRRLSRAPLELPEEVASDIAR